MKCHKCGGEMEAKTLTKDHVHAGVEFRVVMPGFECPADGSWELSPETAKEFERKILLHIATHGPVTPSTMKLLHSATTLKGHELAALLGIAPETLSRWENGKEPINPTHWSLLAAMVRDKATLRQVRAVRDAKPSSKPVPLEIKGAA